MPFSISKRTSHGIHKISCRLTRQRRSRYSESQRQRSSSCRLGIFGCDLQSACWGPHEKAYARRVEKFPSTLVPSLGIAEYSSRIELHHPSSYPSHLWIPGTSSAFFRQLIVPPLPSAFAAFLTAMSTTALCNCVTAQQATDVISIQCLVHRKALLWLTKSATWFARAAAWSLDAWCALLSKSKPWAFCWLSVRLVWTSPNFAFNCCRVSFNCSSKTSARLCCATASCFIWIMQQYLSQRAINDVCNDSKLYPTWISFVSCALISSTWPILSCWNLIRSESNCVFCSSLSAIWFNIALFCSFCFSYSFPTVSISLQIALKSSSFATSFSSRSLISFFSE